MYFYRSKKRQNSKNEGNYVKTVLPGDFVLIQPKAETKNERNQTASDDILSLDFLS